MSSSPPSLATQLRGAWIASGLSLPELARRAELDFGADNLSRKLAGKQVLSTDDAEAIAGALGVTLKFAPTRRRRAA